MIKVLHVVDSLMLGSGVMSVIMNYYRNINKDKVQFDFLFFIKKEDSYYNEIIELGGNAYYLEMLSRKNIFSYQRMINDFFYHHGDKYEIVHLHEVLLSFFILKASKKNKILTRIVHSHNSVGAETILKRIRNRILCLPIKYLATNFCACSIKASNFLYGIEFYKKGKVKIINNAIDCSRFAYNSEVRRQIREKLGFQNCYIIGHIGRFSEQKNHLFLIDVFYHLRKYDKSYKLLLIGGGPLYETIVNKVNRLNLTSDVVFLGVKSDVHNYLNIFDLFILPSLFEGLPVVGVEAQANNLPCVFSDAITKELSITKNNTFISLDKSAEEWAEILSKKCVLSSYPDRSSSVSRLFSDNGFLIRTEASNLENYYKKCKNENM